MDERTTVTDPKRSQKAERALPVPQAERRRMLRQADPADKPAFEFTDWASI
ncbi:MAG: hypothetical protein LJE68_16820 [Rhodobacter sp.]|nr:hypothetical protein [Rhodobacter sp.]